METRLRDIVDRGIIVRMHTLGHAAGERMLISLWTKPGALAGNCLVGFLFFGPQAMSHHVMKGKFNCGALATSISTAAVGVGHAGQQLLRGEGPLRLWEVDLCMSLQHRCGCHCPAGATAALVDNVEGRVQLRPIHALQGQRLCPAVLLQERTTRPGLRLLTLAPEGCSSPAAELCELFLSAIRKGIDASRPELVGTLVQSAHLSDTLIEEHTPILKLLGVMRERALVMANEAVVVLCGILHRTGNCGASNTAGAHEHSEHGKG
mmetsp:Transcript_60829/g.137058  ORF Transcript_60829/g.137058 Transcript_60829/m.137058 type:complete len:264 (-) Transcript_60829:112-903(-)